MEEEQILAEAIDEFGRVSELPRAESSVSDEARSKARLLIRKIVNYGYIAGSDHQKATAEMLQRHRHIVENTLAASYETELKEEGFNEEDLFI